MFLGGTDTGWGVQITDGGVTGLAARDLSTGFGSSGTWGGSLTVLPGKVLPLGGSGGATGCFGGRGGATGCFGGRGGATGCLGGRGGGTLPYTWEDDCTSR